MRDAPESRQWEHPHEAPSLLRFAGFTLDLDARTLVGETGEAVALTRGEFALLRVCVTSAGSRVLSRDALLDALANRRFLAVRSQRRWDGREAAAQDRARFETAAATS